MTPLDFQQPHLDVLTFNLYKTRLIGGFALN